MRYQLSRSEPNPLFSPLSPLIDDLTMLLGVTTALSSLWRSAVAFKFSPDRLFQLAILKPQMILPPLLPIWLY